MIVLINMYRVECETDLRLLLYLESGPVNVVSSLVCVFFFTDICQSDRP